jgi:Domain of unknown function (DUF4218)
MESFCEISNFFREVYSKELDASHIEQLENDIMVIIYKLEKHYSLGFFDSTEHLVVYVAYEVRMDGHIGSRSMYPCERCVLFKIFFYYVTRHNLYIAIISK